jgi:hypothetical protein
VTASTETDFGAEQAKSYSTRRLFFFNWRWVSRSPVSGFRFSQSAWN